MILYKKLNESSRHRNVKQIKDARKYYANYIYLYVYKLTNNF